MKIVLRPFSRVGLACVALCGALLLLPFGWNVFHGMRAMAGETSGASVADDFAAKHRAAIRAEMEKFHRGKVDAATLAKIAAMEEGISSGIAAHGALLPGGFEGVDSAAIAHYLTTAGRAKAPPPAATKLPPMQRLAQASAPTPVTETPTVSRTYVGQKTCLICHAQEASNWAHTIHAAVFTLNPRDEIEAKGCEACHGPGSAHVENPADFSTIISFSHKSQTPVPLQNAQCLSCHQGGQRIFWHGSIHENNNLACSDCHNPMANFAAHGLTARDSINQTCFSCHKAQRAQFNERSHMPLLEGKLSCVDCHNPHGSTTAPLLKADSVNEICYGCHAEKRGPFLFEHAPVRESCLNCHTPHGSNFESLLTAPRPMLCQQCHAQNGHPAQLMTMGNLARGPVPDPRLLSTSCQTCHVNIHGSNDPSGSRFER